MINKKKALRAKLLAKKKEELLLKKELVTLPKNSTRAIEVRKLLGIATMQDLLGDAYPMRICKHCGKRAHNIVELQAFTRIPGCKYGHSEECISCKSLLTIAPMSNIVGLHERLKLTKQTCAVCAETYSTTSGIFGITNHSYDKVCRVCLGTHVVVMGKAVLASTKAIPIISYNSTTRETKHHISYRQCSIDTGVPLSTIVSYLKSRDSGATYSFFLEKNNDLKQAFINKMIAKHGDTYSYNNVVYLNSSYHVAITCRTHGDWLATPINLLNQNTICPHCSRENRGNTFKTRYYSEEPATMYYIYFPTLNLWKVGVTKNTVTTRFLQEKLPIEILLEVTYPIAKLAYDMETKVLQATGIHIYKGPPILNGGNTELRTSNSLKLIKELING